MVGCENRDPRLQRRVEERQGNADGSLSQPLAIAAEVMQDHRMDLAAAIADNPQFNRGFNAMRRELHPLGLARRLVATYSSSSSFAPSNHPIVASRAESVGHAGLVEAPCSYAGIVAAAPSEQSSRKRALSPSHASQSELLSKQFKEDRLRRQQQGSAERRFASVRKHLF
ncbi:uncharacterized protein LOC135943011 [Cloeon dipterum]|uniref:uncharacterized protein LOC135943011 n=1 Tax=Cloeon dipterum TaxID=197152 RepID=UPI00321F7403